MRRYAGLSVVLLAAFALSAHAKIDPKSIAGIWLFDEGTGKTAKDISGNNNNGELKGNAKWTKGKFGGAVEFDGATTSYVEVPSSDSLGMKKQVTVMFWVETSKKMVDMWGDRQTVVGKHYLEYEVGIYMQGQLHTYTSDGAGNYDEGIMTSINGKLPTKEADWEKNTWYHIAWTLKDAHEIAYVNGVMLGEHNKAHIGTLPGVHTLDIGRRQGGALPVTGAVDEVAVFNVALEEADIKAAYEKGIGMASGLLAVEPADKLATTWGKVKNR